MVASFAKKHFLKNMPSEIRYVPRRAYRIPSEINRLMERWYLRVKETNNCRDYRDFVSKVALEGLYDTFYGRANIMEIAVRYGTICDAPIYIDYSVIDYSELLRFNDLVNSKYIRSVQDAVSYCVVAGFLHRVTLAKCLPTRSATPIFS